MPAYQGQLATLILPEFGLPSVEPVIPAIPVFISDAGDNVTAGAPGDVPYVLGSTA